MAAAVPGYGFTFSDDLDWSRAVPPAGGAFPLQRSPPPPVNPAHQANAHNPSFIYTFPLPEDAAAFAPSRRTAAEARAAAVEARARRAASLPSPHAVGSSAPQRRGAAALDVVHRNVLAFSQPQAESSSATDRETTPVAALPPRPPSASVSAGAVSRPPAPQPERDVDARTPPRRALSPQALPATSVGVANPVRRHQEAQQPQQQPQHRQQAAGIVTRRDTGEGRWAIGERGNGGEPPAAQRRLRRARLQAPLTQPRAAHGPSGRIADANGFTGGDRWELADFSYEALLELGSMAVSTGLDVRQIARMPAARFLSANEVVECSVCLDEVEEGNMVLRLVCGHVFHAECIRKWLLRAARCPSCRREVRGCLLR